MSWVYRQPHTEWFYGRDRLIPLGAPQSVQIEAPAGGLGLFGQTPEIKSAPGPTGTHIPLLHPYLVPTGGVYRTTFRVAYRVSIVSEPTGPGGVGVEINAPAGAAGFTGLVADLGDTIVNVPLGGFVMLGRLIDKPTPSLGVVVARPGERTVALFQKQRTVKITLPGDNTVRGALE